MGYKWKAAAGALNRFGQDGMKSPKTSRQTGGVTFAQGDRGEKGKSSPKSHRSIIKTDGERPIGKGGDAVITEGSWGNIKPTEKKTFIFCGFGKIGGSLIRKGAYLMNDLAEGRPHCEFILCLIYGKEKNQCEKRRVKGGETWLHCVGKTVLRRREPKVAKATKRAAVATGRVGHTPFLDQIPSCAPSERQGGGTLKMTKDKI